LLLHRRTQARALAEQQPGLFTQVRTVDSHRANIGQKLNLTNALRLAALRDSTSSRAVVGPLV
jgi:hypothetical protein